MVTWRASSTFGPLALAVVTLSLFGCHVTPTSLATDDLNGTKVTTLCEADLLKSGVDAVQLRPANPTLAARYPLCKDAVWCDATAQEEEGSLHRSIAQVYRDGSCRIPRFPG